jgi:hypothetical protein
LSFLRELSSEEDTPLWLAIRDDPPGPETRVFMKLLTCIPPSLNAAGKMLPKDVDAFTFSPDLVPE